LAIKLTVILRVDGKDIPINEFVQKIISGTIVGAVSSLHNINEDWQNIEVTIKK